jgi:hypothetical protein
MLLRCQVLSFCCLSVRRFIGVFLHVTTIQKKSFRKNYSEIYATDYSFGKTSERFVRQPLDNLKRRGTFEKALQK